MCLSEARAEAADGRIPSGAAEPTAHRRATALIGLAGAIGAFGGVFVNFAFREAFLTSRSGDAGRGRSGGRVRISSVVTIVATSPGVAE